MTLLSHLYPSQQKRKKSITSDNAYYHMPGNDNPNKPGHISKERNDAILSAYNEVVMDKLIKGDAVKLLNKLGVIRIVKYKPRRRLVNFPLTKEEGKIIHHDNLETNGFNIILHWYRDDDAQFRNKRIWSLKLTRDRMRRSPGSIREYAKKHGVTHFLTYVNIRR